MTHKLSTGFTPFHLVYGEDAMMPANILFRSIQMMECLGMHNEFQMDIRQEAMNDLFWKRDDAICLNKDLCERWDKRSQALARKKNLMEDMLVLVCNSSLDKTFQRKFKHRWDGPYIIHNRFTNGTYELKSIDGSLMRERINGVRLKPYH